MTRVLQIRRGSSANNNNFTGLPGEITMDTDTKTLRIHDGETLGGFEIARRDDIKKNNFDINSVPDDKWTEIITRCTKAPFQSFETPDVPINSRVSFLNISINTNLMPIIIQPILICQTPEAGYNAGDKVLSFGIGTRCNPTPNAVIESGELNLYLMVATEKYWVNHKNTGIITTITDENWRILFRVYC